MSHNPDDPFRRERNAMFAEAVAIKPFLSASQMAEKLEAAEAALEKAESELTALKASASSMVYDVDQAAYVIACRTYPYYQHNRAAFDKDINESDTQAYRAIEVAKSIAVLAIRTPENVKATMPSGLTEATRLFCEGLISDLKAAGRALAVGADRTENVHRLASQDLIAADNKTHRAVVAARATLDRLAPDAGKGGEG